MRQPGFISIVLTIIITALLVGGGTYVLVERQAEKQIIKAVQENSKNVQQQAQTQIHKLTERIDELEKEGVTKQGESKYNDWQTYDNQDFNYSFKYPKDWILEDSLLSYTDIKKYEIGSNNAPITFGVYSSNSDIFLNNDNILDFGNKQYHIDNDGRNKADSVRIINGKKFDEYDLISYGQYEGDSAGNVVIFVSQDSLSNNENIKLVFTWEEKPAGNILSGNKKSNFLDIVNTIKFLEDISDWQTYTNEKLKYSLNYPKEYLLEDKDNRLLLVKNLPANLPDDMGGSNTVSIEFLDNDNKLESNNRLYVWAMDGFPEDSKWQAFYNKRAEIIDGVEFTIFDVASGMDRVKEYFLVKNNLVIFIHSSLLGSNDITNSEIISSFKFLD